MSNVVVKIKNSSLTMYRECKIKEITEKQKISYESNFQKAHSKGVMTDTLRKKMTEILETWISCIYLEKKYMPVSVKSFLWYPTFITLTLSKEQTHDDNYIKKHLLFRFIEVLVAKYGVKYYFWRAEKKEGKRIHFHLIVDKYVPWKSIRMEWNNIQSLNGYHPTMAFDDERMGFNSTDIEKVSDCDGALHYISKYCSKDEKNQKINGHIWGCSTALKNLTVPIVELLPEYYNEVERLRRRQGCEVRFEEYYECIYFPKGSNLERVSEYFYDLYTSDLLATFEKLYNSNTYEKINKLDFTELVENRKQNSFFQAELWT